MMRKEIRLPILAIMFLSLGGWLLHARIHPVSFDPANPSHPAFFIPFVAGLLGVVVAPLLLTFKRSFVIGYLINGLTVIIGTFAMASFSIARLPSPLTFLGITTGSLLADIVLLFPKLFLGQMILSYYHPNGMGRLFTAFWWTRHFIYVSVILSLGHFIWG